MTAALVLLLVRVPVFMPVAVPAILPVGGAAVDVELHTLDLRPFRAIIVHVEIAEVQFAQFPLQRAGFHAEVEKCADSHIAADARDAVKVESFHESGDCSQAPAPRKHGSALIWKP